MRVGICEWTTLPASFEEELAAYGAAGAGAIVILEFKLDGVENVRAKVLAGAKLRVLPDWAGRRS